MVPTVDSIYSLNEINQFLTQARAHQQCIFAVYPAHEC